MTPTPVVAATIRALPKAELHLHAEGSIPAPLLARLAAGSVTRRADVDAIYRFTGFGGFLRSFAAVCGHLVRPEAWRGAISHLGRRLTREGVVHAEVFFSAAVHMRNGLSYAALADTLERAAAGVAAAGGPSMLFIADGVRQWGSASFEGMVRAVARHPSPCIVGVGLGGDEGAIPAREFVAGVSEARAAGLAVVLHAGETCGADAIRETVTMLRPDRLAHGGRAVESPALLEDIHAAGLPLDVCLTSNRRTGAVAANAVPPLARLLEAGVRVSLATDDPALFACTLSGEYARAARLGIGARALVELAVESAGASLLPAPERRRLSARIVREWKHAERRGLLGPSAC
ncbi:MAG: adenosine deaminase [Acidobacteriota bacterium]